MQKDLTSRQSNFPVEFSLINKVSSSSYFSFASSGCNWTNKAAEVLSLSLQPLWRDFLSSTVLLIFEHFTQPVTTAIGLFYTTVRQDSLTLFLANETNILAMVWIWHFLIHLCSLKMQALLIRSGIFFSSTRDNGKPRHSRRGCYRSLVNTEIGDYSRSWTSDPSLK